ncbi:MAG: anti-sigma factor domain-containing protein [Roseinatronobacter sp.]
MTDPMRPDDFTPDEYDDLVAAEYVLGTLPDPERRAARDRIEVDGAFAARVQTWETRLAPLNDDYADAPAPDVLPQIEARLFGAPVRDQARAPRRRWFALGWLKGGLAAAVAAMIVAFAFAFWPPAPAPMVLQATLTAEDVDLRFTARWNAAASQLELSRVAGQPAPAGQDYELWLIGPDGVPRSLGLVQDPVTQVATTLAPGLTLAISLEPAGGSPDPVPSGPVLAAAQMVEI